MKERAQADNQTSSFARPVVAAGDHCSTARTSLNSQSRIQGKPRQCLGVFGLSYKTSRSTLGREFKDGGRVEHAALIFDPGMASLEVSDSLYITDKKMLIEH